MPFRLPKALSTDDDSRALSYLSTYYGKGGADQYTGAYFDEFAPNQDPDRFSAEDVVTVSFLSVFVPPMAAHCLLVSHADHFNDLLVDVGPDRDLATEEATIDDTWAARRLYRALLGLPGVGPTTASKLLARKRPRLVPIYDSPLRRELRRPGGDLQSRLLRLKDGAALPDTVSAIRVFDVVTWMEGKDQNLTVETPEERIGAELASAIDGSI
jgi:hypothetical protein